MLFQICSSAVILFLVLDPMGNLAVFSVLLKDMDSKSWNRTILRESLFALLILFLFLFCGDSLLKLLQVSQTSLVLAGGVILFLIALKMVFGSPIIPEDNRKEFFLVPLAIPMIAGPSTIATVILMHSSLPLLQGGLALLLAWAGSTMILLFGRCIASRMGRNALNALESLMGFILAMVSIELLIKGVGNLLQLFRN